MNYYRRYSGDYLRDTARLTLTEHGAYCLLMDYYYTDEKPIPLDHHELYLMLRAMRPEDRKAVDKVLAQFFTQGPDGYHQKRIDHEISVSKTARGNGKGGGRPKTGTITGMETGSVTGMETGQQTGDITGDGGGSGHPPTSNLQPPAASHQPLPAKERKKPKVAPLALPDWVPADAWAAWLEVRPKVKAPNTDSALKIALKELDSLRGQGQDPRAVLEQATTKGYRGLFPVNGSKPAQTLEERNRAAVAGWKPPEAMQ